MEQEKQDILTVSVVNFKVFSRDKDKNKRRIIGFVKAAAAQGSNLIVFPELALSGYDFFVSETVSQMEKEAMTEPLAGEICQEIARAAKENNIAIVFGMPEAAEGKFYNAAVYVDNRGELLSYRKIHPFGKENLFFQKGDQPVIVESEWGNIGISICYDTYQFPELLRYYAAQGCRLILNPTALIEEVAVNKGRKSFENYYIRSLEYSASCNSIFIASANLTGYDEDNYFGGASGIFGPQITPYQEEDAYTYAGGIANTQETLVTATIDLSLANRQIFEINPITGKSDYRLELYKTFLGGNSYGK